MELSAVDNLKKLVSQASSICVKCGLCLPYCPTYKVHQIEGESPRGRLQLMKACAESEILSSAENWGNHIHTYLDHCLSCQACEKVCPANVPYGSIKRNFHELIQLSGKKPVLGRIPWWLKLFIRMGWIRTLSIKLKFPYFFQGLHACLRRFHLDIEKYYPRPLRWILQDIAGNANQAQEQQILKQHRVNDVTQTEKIKPMTVGLLPGCILPFADKSLQEASKELLMKLGIVVKILPVSQCCGALEEHAGNSLHAAKQFNKILADASRLKINKIIIQATGCSVQAKAIHSRLLSHSSDPLISSFASVQTMDILEFLIEQDWKKISFTSEKKLKIFLHEPCTQVNGLGLSNVLYEFIKKIPNLEIIKPSYKFCCGASGTHVLNYPKLAKQYLQPLVSEILEHEVDWLVTANIGCLIHLREALKLVNKVIKISHPVVLLNAITKNS